MRRTSPSSPPQTRAGLLALWSQVAFLTLAVLALYAPDATHPTTPPGGVNPKSGGGSGGDSLGLFVGAVTLSRFGLYMYDVAGAQLFQYLVDEDARAVVGGALSCVGRCASSLGRVGVVCGGGRTGGKGPIDPPPLPGT